MKWFKVFCVFVFITLLIGCSHGKRIVKNKEVTNVSKVLDLKKDSQVVNKTNVISETVDKINLSTIVTEKEEMNTRIVIYDTNLPVDDKTGRPPIKAEIIKSSEKNTVNNSSVVADNSNKTVDKSTSETSVKENLKVKSDSSTTKTSKIKETANNGISALIIISVVVLFLLFVGFLYLKYVKKISIIERIKILLHI